MDSTGWELLLPKGVLDYFEVTGAEGTDTGYLIGLQEKNLFPDEFLGQRLISHGFYETITVKDFPLRGKACYLKVKRRRWLNQDTDKVVSRDWELVAKGTRMTEEFASFLKGMH